MKTRTKIQDYAHAARFNLAMARAFSFDPVHVARFRANARDYIAEGKQYRAMKRQADMFRQLFDLASGGRG